MLLEPLNILVLHRLQNPKLQANSLLNHVFFLKRYQPNHNYLYHDVSLPLPIYIRETPFHAIILDVTFLCLRWCDNFAEYKELYGYVKESNAVKIAFPQDDYDCNELLDEWLVDYGVDVLYSVIPENLDVLYPKYHKRGNIKLGYTGYIDDKTAKERSNTKPFDQRNLDIGYRARKLPPYFGRLGEVKWKIAKTFQQTAAPYNLKCNISTDQKDTIIGPNWFDFIEDCKFTLGTNSGSSLLDPRGKIRPKVLQRLKEDPSVTFEELEADYFPGQDGRWEFTAISPRVFEATLFNSAQILVEGSYSGLIFPWEHYIPIDKDCSNFQETYNAMKDKTFVKKMIKNCHEVLFGNKALRYSDHSERVILTICEFMERKKTISVSGKKMKRLMARYEIEVTPKYKKLWNTQMLKHNFKRKFPDLYTSLQKIQMGKTLLNFLSAK